MATLHFEYQGASLNVTTGADKIEWAYGLNTQTYPTYGGEVVQILSCYVDDITIQGTCRNYRQMEHIYGFFLNYIQNATQTGNFDLEPMKMTYQERGWHMEIVPKQLPGFRFATDLVAPQWQITAHVIDESPEMNQYTKEMFVLTQKVLNEDGFGTLSGDIGFELNNPFSSPDTAKYDPVKTKEALTKVGDWWGNMIPSWLTGDPADLNKLLFSKPAYLQGGKPGPQQKTGKVKK